MTRYDLALSFNYTVANRSDGTDGEQYACMQNRDVSDGQVYLDPQSDGALLAIEAEHEHVSISIPESEIPGVIEALEEKLDQ